MKDAYLTKRLLQGDTEALCQVYHQYKHNLFTVAMSILCRSDLAEDCVHDVFIQFASGPDHVQITQSLKGYLMRCVANRAKNLIKQQQVRRAHATCTPQDPTGSPIGHLIGTEQSMQVFTALAKLPEEQREVITLHLHGQMTFREIGLHLGHSINTVQSRYRYGIEKLRTLL
ncbi:MAG: sigma-70 family RNA polymerase sigma factor [Planctomycetes bacterium]|nr:sigma-70 family RNA polymerase sigma factor [Planctomycetota bacterium]